MILTIKLYIEHVFNLSKVARCVLERIAVTLPSNARWRIFSLGSSRSAFNCGREIPESRGPLDIMC